MMLGQMMNVTGEILIKAPKDTFHRFPINYSGVDDIHFHIILQGVKATLAQSVEEVVVCVTSIPNDKVVKYEFMDKGDQSLRAILWIKGI